MNRLRFLKSRPFLIATGVAAAISIPTLYSDSKRLTFPNGSRQLVNYNTKQPIDVAVIEKPPMYSRREVSAHDCKENRIWVTLENGVYDITDFVEMHPGGERILLAAGKAIDPFWQLFSIHFSKETRELLEQYRIGDLIPASEDDSKLDESTGLEKLFCNEPTRDPSLKVHSERPFNAEAAMSSLESFITPNDKFYVRNHLPVPKMDSQNFELEIDGPTFEDVKLSLSDLKQLPKFSVMVTLQCAGNRRKEMHQVQPVKGLQWEGGAISSAVWTGVRLSDVLRKAGYHIDDPSLDELPGDVKHVQFTGAEGYGASVPAHKVFHPRGDVILAYEMNGEPIPVDHGFPLRAIIPGHTAARSVKWLSKISLDSEESCSHWQQKDYKGFNPSRDLMNSDYSKSCSIQEVPVQSSLISERFVDVDGFVTLKGYAIAGGGRGINRVDVSVDGGKNWFDANLTHPPQANDRQWAWTKWELKVPTENRSEFEVVCKAVDSAYNTQPDTFSGIYNARGVLVSAWQKIRGPIEKP